MTENAPRLREMTAADAEVLERLEAEVEASPWSARNFLDSLRAGHLALVLEAPGDGIVAWTVVMTALDEAELLIIGVSPRRQRRGLGRRLLNAALDRLGSAGCSRMFLEVRAGNRPAQGLYRSMGFLEVGRRRGYYPGGNGGREDAVLMMLELSGRPEPQKKEE